jgi:hypothetical protein
MNNCEHFCLYRMGSDDFACRYIYFFYLCAAYCETMYHLPHIVKKCHWLSDNPEIGVLFFKTFLLGQPSNGRLIFYEAKRGALIL